MSLSTAKELHEKAIAFCAIPDQKQRWAAGRWLNDKLMDAWEELNPPDRSSGLALPVSEEEQLLKEAITLMLDGVFRGDPDLDQESGWLSLLNEG